MVKKVNFKFYLVILILFSRLLIEGHIWENRLYLQVPINSNVVLIQYIIGSTRINIQMHSNPRFSYHYFTHTHNIHNITYTRTDVLYLYRFSI